MSKTGDKPDRTANPFAALQGLRGTLPPGAAEAETDAAEAPRFGAKIVLARERKGRGGKTATVVRGVLPGNTGLAEFAREMRVALGTGGSVEGDTIVLAGDQTARAAEWLRARGARHVVIGN